MGPLSTPLFTQSAEVLVRVVVMVVVRVLVVVRVVVVKVCQMVFTALLMGCQIHVVTVVSFVLNDFRCLRLMPTAT